MYVKINTHIYNALHTWYICLVVETVLRQIRMSLAHRLTTTKLRVERLIIIVAYSIPVGPHKYTFLGHKFTSYFRIIKKHHVVRTQSVWCFVMCSCSARIHNLVLLHGMPKNNLMRKRTGHQCKCFKIRVLWLFFLE